ITSRLSLNAGARLNVAKVSTADMLGTSPELNGDYTFTKLNPMAGLAYKLTNAITVYGGYSESNRAPTPLEIGCSNRDRPCLIESALVADPPLRQVVSHTYEAGAQYTAPRWMAYANYSFIEATYQFDGTIASPNNPMADANGDIFVTPGK